MDKQHHTSFSEKESLPNGITIHHLQLHNRSARESRPIIEFEYSENNDNEVILTIFGAERLGLLADITDYLKSTSLHIKQANIYTLSSNTIIDQFILHDPFSILQHDHTVTHLHDTLVHIINDNNHSKEQLNNYQVTAPRAICNRISSNIALRELEEEHRLEYEASRRQSEAITANFVEHAISSLTNGEYLYYYSSSRVRYRQRFFLSEDNTHLCWGDSNSIRLSRYSGCLFGPKSAIFQNLGNNLVDKEYLCFSLIPKTFTSSTTSTSLTLFKTMDLVCLSVDQLSRWFLGLQSCCSSSFHSSLPNNNSNNANSNNANSNDNNNKPQRLTLGDITRLRVIYKIRAHAHARGLTVRRFILKKAREAGLRQNSYDMYSQYTHEIHHLESELASVQKNLIDHARRETLLNTSMRDFQTSWSVDPSNIEFLHPIGKGAFSEMWKAMWRSTPVAVKCLTTHSFSENQDFRQLQETEKSKSTDGRLSGEDRRLIQDFRLEVTMLNKLRHPNVVLFLGAVTELPNLSILTEFCHGGSLFNALRKRSWRSSLSLQDLRLVARHIARGLCYLHAMRIIHRDLKSQNLLLDRPVEEGCPVIKVADFGLSRNFNGINGIDTSNITGSVAGIMTSETGTYRWMAPEMIRHEPYNEKVDIYSYGVVLWELFSCEIPFQSLSPIQAAYAVADKHLRPKCESDYAKDVKIPLAWQMLIERCWHRSSHERPRFGQVLKILDEMEDCTDGKIPPSLQREIPGFKCENIISVNQTKQLLQSSTNHMSLQSCESTGDPSNAKLDSDQDLSSFGIPAQTGKTGFRRSGSSPALITRL